MLFTCLVITVKAVNLRVAFSIVLGKIHHVAECQAAWRRATKIFHRILSILFSNTMHIKNKCKS